MTSGARVLEVPDILFAISEWYENFDQVGDEEVNALLETARPGNHLASGTDQ
jgi:predicted phosphoribosyltransferase